MDSSHSLPKSSRRLRGRIFSYCYMRDNKKNICKFSLFFIIMIGVTVLWIYSDDSITCVFPDLGACRFRNIIRYHRSIEDPDSITTELSASNHFEENLWYRHMKQVVSSVHNESCYVCALLPHAAGRQQLMRSEEISHMDSQCLLHMAICKLGGQIQPYDIVVEELWVNSTKYEEASEISYVKMSAFGASQTPIYRCMDDDDSKHCGYRTMLRVLGNHFQNNGWFPYVRGLACAGQTLWNFTSNSSLLNDTDQCKGVWEDFVTSLTWSEEPEEKGLKVRKLRKFDVCYFNDGKGQRLGTNTQCKLVKYEKYLSQGTAVLMDVYWQCGSMAYTRLPGDWSGVCSMVRLIHPLLVIPKHAWVPGANVRRKRSPYFAPEEVPDDFKIFSKAEIFFASWLTPGLQASANAKWIQKNRYELLKFINITDEALNAVKEELRGLRLTTVQNRYALDMILASQGGVCAVIGDSCCTFIPANDDEHNGTLVKAIEHLHSLRKQMIDEAGVTGDWFSGWSLNLPSWFLPLLKTVMFACAPVLLLCFVGLLLFSCCKRLFLKATMMMAYTPVATQEDKDQEFELCSLDEENIIY